jgi:hypothetical protein
MLDMSKLAIDTVSSHLSFVHQEYEASFLIIPCIEWNIYKY